MVKRRPSQWWIVTTLLMSGVVAAAGYGFLRPKLLANADAQGTEPQENVKTHPGFSRLVTRVGPAVVSVTSTIRGGASNPGTHRRSRERRGATASGLSIEESLGSGFLVDRTGLIITNNHVVKGARSVSVTLDDGTVLPAKVIRRDPRADLAELKIESRPAGFPFIRFGESNAVAPGQWVIAIGNPFGLGGTVTAGIVSARDRNVGAGIGGSFIQTDVPINPGNSGGPLFTEAGEVVGVNTLICSPNDASVGISFAIPSDVVRDFIRRSPAPVAAS